MDELMTWFEYRRPGEVVGWDFDDVTAFLVARGYRIGPGGVGTGVEGTAALVRADLDRDPATDLGAYAPPADPIRTARVYLRNRLAAIRATAPAQRTAGDRDLLAVLALLREDQ
jgi:hypothetical protein